MADLAPKVHRLGLLTEVDLHRFAMLCAHLSRWRRLYEADPLGTDHTKGCPAKRDGNRGAAQRVLWTGSGIPDVALKVQAKPGAGDELETFLAGSRR